MNNLNIFRRVSSERALIVGGWRGWPIPLRLSNHSVERPAVDHSLPFSEFEPAVFDTEDSEGWKGKYLLKWLLG
jgi:hypothetical protein